MKKGKDPEKPVLESVKVEKKFVDLARMNKKKTYKPIGVFIGEAIQEKFQKETGTTEHTHVTNTNSND